MNATDPMQKSKKNKERQRRHQGMSKKISVDLTDENAGALYQNKKVHGLGYGPTINMLIRIFFRSPDIRDDLIEICKSKIQSGNLVYLDMLQFLTYDTQLTHDAV